MSTFESGIGQTTVDIHGKPFAGKLVNVIPATWFHHKNCIAGFLLGKDHIHGRGFSNQEVRTSPVKKLVIQDSILYAITMNSAYALMSVELTAFTEEPSWKDRILSVIENGEVQID